MKTLTLLAVIVAVECGGSHVVGKDRCTVSSCAQSETCDFDGTCRTLCGPNSPGVTCPAGEVCSGYICRATCTPGTAPSCPAGSSCQGTQTTGGGTSICGPVSCRDASACQAGEACIRGTCTTSGYACGPDQTCGTNNGDVTCDNGTCRVRCGANYPSTTCASGQSCGAAAYCL